MKNIRKIVSLVLAFVMVLAMSATALAATVTVPAELNGHTFKAYQIFTGTQAASEGALGDVQWGSGINKDTFLAALKADTTIGEKFADCITAADVAAVLGEFSDKTTEAGIVAKLAYANKSTTATILTSGDNNLDKGYYLIVDESSNLNEGDYALNKALLQVTDKIEIGLKTDKPSVEKKVQEDDKYNNVQNNIYGNGYNDVADYNIGDHVPFKLIGTVPDMTYYDTYQYIFHDTLSAGLTLDTDSIKVYVASDKAGTDKAEITGWTKAVDGRSFTVSFVDLKTVVDVSAGKYIIVEYTATLNGSAEVGLPGNENKVYLEYSNNPNQGGEGTGRTPEDKVIVFTYELDTTKIDGATVEEETPAKLKDAEFKLHDVNNKWVIVDTDGKVTGWSDTEAGGSILKSDENGLFKVIGLDDGTYHLKETKAPDGYNKLTGEIEVIITATTSNRQDWDGVPGDALTNLDVTANGQTGTADTGTGIAGITVANNQGTKLPETGGIGTTIFYIIGSLMMLVAAVLLITKRKMAARND